MISLLIGCGGKRQKRLGWGCPKEWGTLITLDMNEDHKPDVVHDLTVLPLPFPDNHFDEIHAYDVLEHTGQQGDWRFFFDQWAEFWRILKPCGTFCGISPHWKSPWAWGDPGHTRIVCQEQFTYLNQEEYKRQVGVTPLTDYRFYYKADLRLVFSKVDENQQFYYILQAVKS